MKTLLFKPFEQYSEKLLIFIGLGMTVLGTFLAQVLNSRFDGAFDLHFIEETLLQQAFIDTFINITSLIFFLYGAALIVNRKTRFVDIITTVTIARIPYYILPLLNMNNKLTDIGTAVLKSVEEDPTAVLSVEILPWLILTTIVTIGALVWYITLLYNGYKIASNAKKGSHVPLFIAALLSAEIASKILIHLLN